MVTFVVNTYTAGKIVPLALKAKGAVGGRPLVLPETDFLIGEHDNALKQASEAPIGKRSAFILLDLALLAKSVIQCPGSRLLSRSTQTTTRPQANGKSPDLEERQRVSGDHFEYAVLCHGRPAANRFNAARRAIREFG